jgi:hypothetical protein
MREWPCVCQPPQRLPHTHTKGGLTHSEVASEA